MDKIDIIIFCGQSNMQGQTEVLSSGDAVSHAYEYRWLNDEIVPLADPVGEDIRYDKTAGEGLCEGADLGRWLSAHVTGSACYGHTSLIPRFCREYVKESSCDVLALHIAKGSTEISYWMPGSVAYGIMIEKVSSAVTRAQDKYQIGNIFFVWFQGESDAIAGNSTEYYSENLIILEKSLKKDLNIDKFGIIRVGRFTKDERDLKIIKAQDELCANNPDFLMLTDLATQLSSEGRFMNPYVSGHYSAAGLELIGAAAGSTLAKYRNSLC